MCTVSFEETIMIRINIQKYFIIHLNASKHGYSHTYVYCKMLRWVRARIYLPIYFCSCGFYRTCSKKCLLTSLLKIFQCSRKRDFSCFETQLCRGFTYWKSIV